MKGKNKELKENPLMFLRANGLNPGGGVNNYLPGDPVVDIYGTAVFDLVPAVHGSVRIQSWVGHPKTHKLGNQHPLRAYWLKYDGKEIHTVQLGIHADFVFTPLLDGCFIGIGQGLNPKITHIPGSDKQNHDRDTQTVTTLAVQEVGTLSYSFNSNDFESPCFTFIGARTRTGWDYYIQGHDYDYGSRHFQLKALGNGVTHCAIKLDAERA